MARNPEAGLQKEAIDEIVEFDPVWMPLAGGTRLAAAVRRPKDAERDPFPITLEYLPGGRRDETA